MELKIVEMKYRRAGKVINVTTKVAYFSELILADLGNPKAVKVMTDGDNYYITPCSKKDSGYRSLTGNNKWKSKIMRISNMNLEPGKYTLEYLDKSDSVFRMVRL